MNERSPNRVCPAGAAQDRRAGPQSPRRGLVFPCDIKVRTAASSASWGRQDHLILLKAGAGLSETPKQGANSCGLGRQESGCKGSPNSRRFYSGRETWEVSAQRARRAGEPGALQGVSTQSHFSISCLYLLQRTHVSYTVSAFFSTHYWKIYVRHSKKFLERIRQRQTPSHMVLQARLPILTTANGDDNQDTACCHN